MHRRSIKLSQGMRSLSEPVREAIEPRWEAIFEFGRHYSISSNPIVFEPFRFVELFDRTHVQVCETRRPTGHLIARRMIMMSQIIPILCSCQMSSEMTISALRMSQTDESDGEEEKVFRQSPKRADRFEFDNIFSDSASGGGGSDGEAKMSYESEFFVFYANIYTGNRL